MQSSNVQRKVESRGNSRVTQAGLEALWMRNVMHYELLAQIIYVRAV